LPLKVVDATPVMLGDGHRIVERARTQA